MFKYDAILYTIVVKSMNTIFCKSLQGSDELIGLVYSRKILLNLPTTSAGSRRRSTKRRMVLPTSDAIGNPQGLFSDYSLMIEFLVIN
jgi:hypothetical protein